MIDSGLVTKEEQEELIKKAIALKEEGYSQVDIAKALGKSQSWVSKVIKQQEINNSIETKRQKYAEEPKTYKFFSEMFSYAIASVKKEFCFKDGTPIDGYFLIPMDTILLSIEARNDTMVYILDLSPSDFINNK